MQVRQLNYSYPEELVATKPQDDFRTLLKEPGQPPREIKKEDIFELFTPGDALVVNDTKVLKRRVFSSGGLEVLFVQSLSETRWEVLFPAKKTKVGETIALPGGLEMSLVKKGLPQTVELSYPATEDYFEKHAEMALPPYIQKARAERHNFLEDERWYQTDWATRQGSAAAPTASLHFNSEDLDQLRQKGVKVLPLTLHVGLGTFLPVHADNLEDHTMHEEEVFIPAETVSALKQIKENQRRIWALGTTATRALEGWAQGHLEKNEAGDCVGQTGIFIQPGDSFQVVDALMTNFHQPESTLLALVAAFSGLNDVLEAYQWAIEKRFRLFSYGDLSIWISR